MQHKLKGSERKHLRGLAHGMKPVVQIGKKGLSPDVVSEIDQALRDHELIKVRFNEFKEEKSELSAGIERETGCEMVGMIGNIGIFYRENPEGRKIVFRKE